MKFYKKVGALALLLMLLAASMLAQSCGSDSVSAEDLVQMYADAIADAKSPSNAKISKDLTAITASEEGLVWEGDAGASRLLVITTMSEYAYQNYGYQEKFESGEDYTLIDTALSWVTAVPMAIDYFKTLGYSAANVTNLRFAQALGLPEPSEERMVVGLYVNIADLFRPCPDPEINDHECELDFPTNHSGGFLAFDDSVKIRESEACANDGCIYDDWFENRRNIVYTGANSFPWTQLGYTYDWASDAPDGNIGLSEFAVKGGSVFNVVSADKASDYFIGNWDVY
jgi:hypothetical protein